METKLEQIAVKAVNQLPKSVVREIRTPRSVGAGGGRPPPATRWARRNPRSYRDHPRGLIESRLGAIFSLEVRSQGSRIWVYETTHSRAAHAQARLHHAIGWRGSSLAARGACAASRAADAE